MNKIFQTDSLALAPYLQMHGLKYISSEIGIGKNDKPIVYFNFEDPKGIGKDLELDFMRSDIKKYRDMFFFFRNEIEKTNRQIQQKARQDRDKIYEGK